VEYHLGAHPQDREDDGGENGPSSRFGRGLDT